MSKRNAKKKQVAAVESDGDDVEMKEGEEEEPQKIDKKEGSKQKSTKGRSKKKAAAEDDESAGNDEDNDAVPEQPLEEEAKSNEDETLSTVAAKKPGKKQKTTKQSTADELNEIFLATEQDQHLAKTRGGKSTQMKDDDNKDGNAKSGKRGKKGTAKQEEPEEMTKTLLPKSSGKKKLASAADSDGDKDHPKMPAQELDDDKLKNGSKVGAVVGVKIEGAKSLDSIVYTIEWKKKGGGQGQVSSEALRAAKQEKLMVDFLEQRFLDNQGMNDSYPFFHFAQSGNPAYPDGVGGITVEITVVEVEKK